MNLGTVNCERYFSSKKNLKTIFCSIFLSFYLTHYLHRMVMYNRKHTSHLSSEYLLKNTAYTTLTERFKRERRFGLKLEGEFRPKDERMTLYCSSTKSNHVARHMETQKNVFSQTRLLTRNETWKTCPAFLC